MKSTNKERLISKEEYTFYKDKRIWSKTKGIFLKGTVMKNGYVEVKLKCIDGKQRQFLWHRVIWYMFNGEIPEGYEVNHIDENKQNNALSNLNLMTPKENINHGTRNERVAAKQKGRKLSEETKEKIAAKLKGNKNMLGKHLSEEIKAKLKNNPLKSKAVVAVDNEGNVVYEFASTAEAGRKGFHQGHVAECCRDELKHHKGLRWFFKSDWLAMQKQIASPHRREDAIQL